MCPHFLKNEQKNFLVKIQAATAVKKKTEKGGGNENMIHDEDVFFSHSEKKLENQTKENHSAGMPRRNLISPRLVKHINMKRSAGA